MCSYERWTWRLNHASHGKAGLRHSAAHHEEWETQSRTLMPTIMTEFQILSDLHLENPSAYDVFLIPPKAPYLALLGDIGVIKDGGFFPFIKTQLARFQIVFFLLGNHEPYHSNWSYVREKIQQFSDSISSEQSLGSFVFLNRTRHDLSPDVTILGCTLYSRIEEAFMNDVSFGLNDFYQIDGWTVEDHCASHDADLKWLNEQVSYIARSEPQRKIVIFTHHSPISRDSRAVDPKHANSPLSSGFATDLSMEECWKTPQVRLWAFGHTHYNACFTEEDTGKQVVSNQRGYYFAQAQAFDAEMVIRV